MFLQFYSTVLPLMAFSTWEYFWLIRDGETFRHFFIFMSNWMMMLNGYLHHYYNRNLHIICYFYGIITTLIYWFFLHKHYRCNGDCLLMTINIHGGVWYATSLLEPITINHDWNDFAVILCFGLVYHVWAIIYHYFTGKWIYDFLNIYRIDSLFMYVGITVIYVMVTMIHQAYTP